jgi:hypothetical protein
VRCEVWVRPGDGLSSLEPVDGFSPCVEPGRYRAVWLIDRYLTDDNMVAEHRVTGHVCVEHAIEARFPLETWKQRHPGATIPLGMKFVACVQMTDIPLATREASAELRDLVNA